MLARYFNLEYWFYRIYLLLQAVYDYLTFFPRTLLEPTIRMISFVLNLLFFGLLIYSWYKTKKIRKKENDDFLAAFAVAADSKVEKAKEWQDIVDHVDSDNESQWKLALIEADKILEDLLREAQFDGEGVGERLKNAELQGGLKSLQDAWEAHKIRNKIAHEQGFILTKREARVAIESYKKVFEELEFFSVS